MNKEIEYAFRELEYYVNPCVMRVLKKHIDDQAARIAEQQGVIDQRNRECDRLINELAALREQAAPVAVPDDLIMLIRQLVHSLKKSCPDHRLVKSVPDYMARMGYWQASDCLRLNSGERKK